MTKTTKYLVQSQDGSPVGSPHDNLVDAVLDAASYDGFGACFLRMNDEGDEHPSFPMRFFSSRTHIGNNPYMPDAKTDAFEAESDLTDDSAAKAAVASAIYTKGILHSRYPMTIEELHFTDGVLTGVGHQSLQELADDLDATVDQVRESYTAFA